MDRWDRGWGGSVGPVGRRRRHYGVRALVNKLRVRRWHFVLISCSFSSMSTLCGGGGFNSKQLIVLAVDRAGSWSCGNVNRKSPVVVCAAGSDFHSS